MSFVYSNINEKQLSKQNRLFDVLGHGKLEHIVCDFTALVRLLASKHLWNAFCVFFQKNPRLRIECVKGTAIDLATNGLMGDVGADEKTLIQYGVGHDWKTNFRNAMDIDIHGNRMIIVDKNFERPPNDQFGTVGQKKKDRLYNYRTVAHSLVTNSHAVFLTDSYNDNDSTWLNTSPSVKICSTPLLLILLLHEGIIAAHDLQTIIESLFPLVGDGDKSYNNKGSLPSIALRYSTAICVYHRRKVLCDGRCQHNASPCSWMTPELWNRLPNDWRTVIT